MDIYNKLTSANNEIINTEEKLKNIFSKKFNRLDLQHYRFFIKKDNRFRIL